MYLLRWPDDLRFPEQRKRIEEYHRYLETPRVRRQFPERALEFALAPWHYDPQDHRCPHDAWVESVTISEPSSGERHQVRSLEIRIELLGPYHDGRIRIAYPGVRRYSLFQPLDHGPHHPKLRGHGDWVVDQITSAGRGSNGPPIVLHEIVFSNDAVWTIESEDIVYEWIPNEAKG